MSRALFFSSELIELLSMIQENTTMTVNEEPVIPSTPPRRSIIPSVLNQSTSSSSAASSDSDSSTSSESPLIARRRSIYRVYNGRLQSNPFPSIQNNTIENNSDEPSDEQYERNSWTMGHIMRECAHTFDINMRLGDLVIARDLDSFVLCQITSIEDAQNTFSKIVTIRYREVNSDLLSALSRQMCYGDEFKFDLQASFLAGEPFRTAKKQETKKRYRNEFEAKVEAYTDPQIAAICELTDGQRVLRNRAILKK